VPRAKRLPLARRPRPQSRPHFGRRRALSKLNDVRGPVGTDSSSTVGSNEIDDPYRNLPWNRLFFRDGTGSRPRLCRLGR
jgi:hypothetical protein